MYFQLPTFTAFSREMLIFDITTYIALPSTFRISKSCFSQQHFLSRNLNHGKSQFFTNYEMITCKEIVCGNYFYLTTYKSLNHLFHQQLLTHFEGMYEFQLQIFFFFVTARGKKNFNHS